MHEITLERSVDLVATAPHACNTASNDAIHFALQQLAKPVELVGGANAPDILRCAEVQ